MSEKKEFTLDVDDDDMRHQESYKKFLLFLLSRYRDFGVIDSDTAGPPSKKKSSKTECKDTCCVKLKKTRKNIQILLSSILDWAGRVFLFILSYSDIQNIFKFLSKSIYLSNFGPSFKCCPILKHVFIITWFFSQEGVISISLLYEETYAGFSHYGMIVKSNSSIPMTGTWLPER